MPPRYTTLNNIHLIIIILATIASMIYFCAKIIISVEANESRDVKDHAILFERVQAVDNFILKEELYMNFMSNKIVLIDRKLDQSNEKKP